jgi:hypothetical protein
VAKGAAADFVNMANTQASVANYFKDYNHDRLRSSIGSQTPHHIQGQRFSN